ncbi:MAG: prepilin-type N-terminal cleavage/methylation domain-containing protein [Verrucomicrobiaceae bacterium]|nr:prepilin-type N-terminal cleavage/methylation domain-containing protein [Verrucomicrobiaceae bacterium]
MTNDECAGAIVPPAVRHHRSPPFRHSSFRPRGFTLVEVVIAMTIIIIIAAAAIPTFKGLQAEQQTREPVEALTRLAKEARLRAMKEKRPYQVVFRSTGFTASRYLSPYLQLAGLTEFLDEVEQKAKEPPPEEDPGNETNASRPTGDQVIYTKSAEESAKKFEEWTEDYKFPQGMHCAVKMWYDADATEIAGDIMKLWVFQPSGICQPLTVTLQNDSAVLQVEYGALTADILKEATSTK